jgi:DNA modification methylase
MQHYQHKIISVSDLIPYANNSRTHTAEQVNAVASSIKEFGFTQPVLIDEQGGIIAGHCRVEAAQKIGLTDVPCITLKGLTKAQKKAYVIADNQLTLHSGSAWDLDTLKLEVESLIEMDFDTDLLGFDDDFLPDLLNDPTDGLTDEDEVSEAPADPVTQLGDVWQLGDHRLMCGDSTSADDVGKLLAGVKPHLMVTDPPYGVEYDANWRNEADRANGKPYGASAVGKVQNDDKADWSEAWALFPGDVAYVWHADKMGVGVGQDLMDAGFNLRAMIIWAKNNICIGRGDYHPKHEPCWYAVKKNRKGHWSGGRKQSTVWNIDKPMKSETGHSTQKPVECMRRPIENNSSPGQAVYEPFSGSGTTIIAAETTGRVCYAMEIAPEYVDMAVKRWQSFTGKEATNQNGDAYNDLVGETGLQSHAGQPENQSQETGETIR